MYFENKNLFCKGTNRRKTTQKISSIKNNNKPIEEHKQVPQTIVDVPIELT